MKSLKTLSIAAILFAIACTQANAQNLQFRSNLSYGSSVLSNICGYVDTTGIEYALVGTENGMDIVDVSDPANPVIRFSVPGPQSAWREIKTYRKYAYVTTEGGGGLIVVDLTQLPNNINYQNYTGDGAIAGQLDAIHALHCDTATGFLYLFGSGLFSGSTVFLDLSDPWNPTFAGNYMYAPDPYVHDSYILNDTMYECHIYGGFFTIVDVTNKANPVLLGTQTTPTNFTHNSWLSVDGNTLFTTDENTNSFLTAYDITDPGNIQELSRFQTAPGSGAIVHNTHILNDYAITSWYKEGVVITDVSRPHNPIEVGHYDTYPQGSGDGFNGCWGVYPFLPSGTIVASDIDNGLFVLTPTYIRGCYLEGMVTDSITSSIISGASLSIVSTTISTVSNSNGDYATGTATAGTYDVTVSKAGYITKHITGVVLTNGVLTTLNVELAPMPSFVYSGTATDSLSGLPLANATVVLQNSSLTYTATSNSNGDFSFPGVVDGTYDMVIGKWGYQTQCSSKNLAGGAVLTAELSRGYYDDFTFDFGWTVISSTSNEWERGKPVGTFNNNSVEINPEFDVTGDCGENCFVTDNGGNPYNNHDIDNGFTILYSPVFDGTIYINPEVSYYRRFLDIDGLGTPNDSMVISIINGTDSVNLEMIGPNDPTNGSWTQASIPLSGLITITSTMQLVVRVFDDAPGNICEGALDQFQIIGQLTTGLSSVHSFPELNAYPNPFRSSIVLNLSSEFYTNSSKVSVKDVSGRIVYSQPLTSSKIDLAGLNDGLYFLEVESANLEKRIIRILKVN